MVRSVHFALLVLLAAPVAPGLALSWDVPPPERLPTHGDPIEAWLRLEAPCPEIASRSGNAEDLASRVEGGRLSAWAEINPVAAAGVLVNGDRRVLLECIDTDLAVGFARVTFEDADGRSDVPHTTTWTASLTEYSAVHGGAEARLSHDVLIAVAPDLDVPVRVGEWSDDGGATMDVTVPVRNRGNAAVDIHIVPHADNPQAAMSAPIRVEPYDPFDGDQDGRGKLVITLPTPDMNKAATYRFDVIATGGGDTTTTYPLDVTVYGETRSAFFPLMSLAVVVVVAAAALISAPRGLRRARDRQRE